MRCCGKLLAGLEWLRHPNCEVAGSDGDGPFTLQTSSGSFGTKALIVAAGRWSQFTVDRTVPPGPKWIGLKAHFQESWTEPCTDLYFFANGYCGVQPVTEGVVNACAMVRSDRATSLEEVCKLHQQVGTSSGQLARDHAARQHCAADLSRAAAGPRKHDIRRRRSRVYRSVCRRRHFHRLA